MLKATALPSMLEKWRGGFDLIIISTKDGKLISSAGSRATSVDGKVVGDEAIAAILANMWTSFERCPDPKTKESDKGQSALSSKVRESDESGAAVSMLLEMDTGSNFSLIEAKAQHGGLSEALRGVFSKLAI